MKKRNPKRSRLFWGQCLDLWFVCWISYCACEYLLHLFFYMETLPHERNYSILFWTQHAVFAVAYYLIFSRPDRLTAPARPQDDLPPLRAVGDFFRRDWRQLLLLAGCAVLYEALQAVFPDSDDLASALLVMLFPSAAVIGVPVLRTLIGFSISLVSMLFASILAQYKTRKPKPGKARQSPEMGKR